MIADEQAAIPEIEIQRTNLMISGEQAVVLEGLSGVASARNVLIVHGSRLYRLAFVPWDETGEDFARIEDLHDTIINSFTFVPILLPAESTETSHRIGGSAVVLFVQDGDILVWEEATAQSHIIFDSGDVTRVELSDDGQLVAFLHRTYFEAGGFDKHEKSALWVVGRNGEDPRELVSADELRTLLNASETDSTKFPRLE